jgi:hypothetical protein
VVKDDGWQTLSHGWFDVQCQGAPYDYCRWVGASRFLVPLNKGSFWSCSLAGSGLEYSLPGEYREMETKTHKCPHPKH